MAKSKGRGRPPKYVGNVKKHIVSLVKQHGATGARAILNAAVRTKLGKQRNVKLVPKPLGISMPTLLGLAKAAGVKLHRGRPKAA